MLQESGGSVQEKFQLVGRVMTHARSNRYTTSKAAPSSSVEGNQESPDRLWLLSLPLDGGTCAITNALNGKPLSKFGGLLSNYR